MVPGPLARTNLSRAIAASLLWGGPCYAFFLALVFASGGGLTAERRWALALAGSWLVLAPGLIYLWDSRVADLVVRIQHAGGDERWDKPRLLRVCIAAERAFWPFTMGLVAVILVHFDTQYDFYQRLLALGGRYPFDFWVGILSVGLLAWTFGVGIWGVGRTMRMVSVTSDINLRFDVFKPFQIAGVEHAARTFYLTGLYFSFGNVLTPAVLMYFTEFETLGRVIAVIVLLSLELGGAACFVYTSARMSRMARVQREQVVQHFGDLLERWVENVSSKEVDALVAEHDAIDAVLGLRAAALESTVGPSGLVQAQRVAVLLLLPATLTAVQPLLTLSLGR